MEAPATAIPGRIAKASLIVLVAHQLLKLAGLAQAIVAGALLERQELDAVYVLAFEQVIFALFLVGEEIIGPTFLPVFSNLMREQGEAEAWRFAGHVLGLQTLLLLVVAGMLTAWPVEMIRWLSSSYIDANPERLALAASSVRYLAPALVVLSLGSTTYILLNGYKRFFLAAFGDTAWKLIALVALVAGAKLAGTPARWLVVGLAWGASAKLAVHVIGLWHERRLWRIGLDFRHPGVRSMALLALPVVVGVLLAKARDYMNNGYLLTTLDTPGLLAANSYGRKLYTTLAWLIPYPVSIAMFPFFCDMEAEGRRDKLAEIVTASGRMVLAITLPLSLVCVVLAEPLASLFFEWGKFDAQQVRWTAVSLQAYILVLPAFSLEIFLMQAYFASRRMVSSVALGAFFSLLSVGLAWAGIVVLGARGATALLVIALSFTLCRTLKTVALVGVLRRSHPVFAGSDTGAFFARMAVCGFLSAAAVALTECVFQALFSATTKPIILMRCTAGSTAAVLVFIMTTKLLRLEEPKQMMAWALRKLKERRGGGKDGTASAAP